MDKSHKHNIKWRDKDRKQHVRYKHLYKTKKNRLYCLVIHGQENVILTLNEGGGWILTVKGHEGLRGADLVLFLDAHSAYKWVYSVTCSYNIKQHFQV